MSEATLVRVIDEDSPFYEWEGRVRETRARPDGTALVFVEFIGMPRPLVFRQSQIKAMYRNDMAAIHLLYDFDMNDRGYAKRG